MLSPRFMAPPGKPHRSLSVRFCSSSSPWSLTTTAVTATTSELARGAFGSSKYSTRLGMGSPLLIAYW
jgi:hypothetical protein